MDMTEALQDRDVRRTYEEEVLYNEATDTVEALLESLQITRKELAQRLGVSQRRVNQILSGSEDLTLRTLAALAWALGLRLELHATPMADRRGTPAEGDLDPPSWLSALSR